MYIYTYMYDMYVYICTDSVFIHKLYMHVLDIYMHGYLYIHLIARLQKPVCKHINTYCV